MSSEPNTRARARAVTIVLVAVALALAAALARYGDGWRVDNRVDSWASSAGQDAGYTELVERFGGDAVVLVRVDGLWGPYPSEVDFDLENSGPGFVQELIEAKYIFNAQAVFAAGLGPRLAALPAVQATFDPLALPMVRKIAPWQRFDGWLEASLDTLERSAVVMALDAVRTSPRRLDFVVSIAPDALPEQHAALAAGIDELRREATVLGLRLRAAGHPLVAAGLDVESRRVDLVFGPLLVVVALVACVVFLRSLPLALVTMLPGALASLALRAGLRAAGIDANMILVAGAPLVFVVHVAAMLHLALRFQRHVDHGEAPRAAARAAFRDTFGAALFAAWTTAIGFGVFVFSGVSAVRHLGLAVGVVVAVGVPLAYLVAPLALPGCARRADDAAAEARAGRARRASRRWRRLAAGAARRRGSVLALAALGCLAGAFAPIGMPVSTNALDYFPAGHSVREEFLALEREGASLSTLDVLVPCAPPGVVDEAWLATLVTALEALPGVAGTFGPSDVARDVEAELGSTLGRLATPAALRTAGRLDTTGEVARVTVRASSSDLASLEQLAADVRAQIAAAPQIGDGRPVQVASSLTRLTALHDALVGTLASSLAMTGGVALLAFLLVLRGARERLAAVVANVLPVALALVAVRLLGHALDAATVMVASVVMGIAVDTTFHLLLSARRAGVSPFAERRAILASFGKVGDAAFASAVVLAAGFGALALADFAPTARFGLACAIGVVVALIADLVVVPAIALPQPGGRGLRRNAGSQ